MDAWIFSRNDCPNDLLGIFSALGDLQYQYDWVISDTGLYFMPDTPDEVRRRWSWTGLLMGGQELTEHLTAGYVHFVFGGILSAVPKGTRPEQVWNYTPSWEVDFESPDYRFQTPLTQLEIINHDGNGWVIVCGPEFSAKVRSALPKAKTFQAYYESKRSS